MSVVLVWAGVMLCGGVGAVLRFTVDGEITRRAVRRLPVGTLLVNLSGAVLLGLVDGLVLDRDAALLVGTGIIGSYTTFSTWMYETHRLAEERQLPVAITNVVLSVVAGVAAAALGLWIGGGL
ncbi:fluoride efflux transporter CrcB [Nocardioides terrisoli]|uniref:fluoride efflux transporter CrcB n=1 Tax=Nocardioides terrisoli TaxID=3388267 RepID=UPI00287BC669|nr:fluoride efflux transporter CrcB [Nocardioides marmorisolisilvae]